MPLVRRIEEHEWDAWVSADVCMYGTATEPLCRKPARWVRCRGGDPLCYTHAKVVETEAYLRSFTEVVDERP